MEWTFHQEAKVIVQTTSGKTSTTADEDLERFLEGLNVKKTPSSSRFEFCLVDPVFGDQAGENVSRSRLHVEASRGANWRFEN